MTPYYSHGGITIYHGDCMDVIDVLAPHFGDKPFDLLLTDPPYGIRRDGMKASTGSHGGRKAYDFLGWDDAPPSPATIIRCVKVCHEAVIWGGNYMALPKPSAGWFVWDKGQRIDQSDGELAWTSTDRALRIFTLNRSELARDGAVHPTQKPLRLMKIMPLRTRRSSTRGRPWLLGKNGRRRAICASADAIRASSSAAASASRLRPHRSRS